jgi:hypothetical protein
MSLPKRSDHTCFMRTSAIFQLDVVPGASSQYILYCKWCKDALGKRVLFQVPISELLACPSSLEEKSMLNNIFEAKHQIGAL